jgi:hypothetical protein
VLIDNTIVMYSIINLIKISIHFLEIVMSKVLIIDDSIFTRSILKKIVKGDIV